MISWMQKHNRYLVWTIWIATIAFIGAGFVGWGSYQFGGGGDKIAKVGDISIDKSRYDFAYTSIYNSYNNQLNGQLDEKKAKELKISEQALSMVENQAKLLNLAQHYGIDADAVEIAQALQSMDSFQTDGKFDKKLYEQQLLNIKLKPSAYEDMLRDEIIVSKLSQLLNAKPTTYENDIVASAFLGENKIAYKILTANDVKIDTTDVTLQSYWAKNKSKFMHPTKYKVDILWTPLDKKNITEKNILDMYNTNSYKYTDANGKQLSIEDARKQVIDEIAIENTKKTAQKSYIEFKNGKNKTFQTTIISENNQTIGAELMNELKNSTSGAIIKPKVTNNQYATVRIVEIIKPKAKEFNEAKNQIIDSYRLETSKTALSSLAKNTLTNIDKLTPIDTKIVSLRNNVNINGLNNEENSYFLQKLFTTTEENGIITLDNKVIVYKILSKGLLTRDTEETKMVYKSSTELKKSIFEANLLKLLSQRYITANN